MTKALAYMRCSGDGQIAGDTWDRQLAAIQRCAREIDTEVIQEYRDEGVTGKMELENRPGLAACLAHIETNGVRLVIVESADRLARDSMVSELIIRQFQKAGARVISASGNVDLTAGDDSNPTAKLIRQILAAIAEFDRCVTVLRLKAARQRIKLQKGRCEGVKPFGRDDYELRILLRIRQLRELKVPTDSIADTLNSEGLHSRNGKPWRGSTIRKILLREKNQTVSA